MIGGRMMFDLGQVVATPAALELLAESGIEYSELLYRHHHLESPELDEADRQANQLAIKNGDRMNKEDNIWKQLDN
jgi:hypothetical protein